MAAASIHIMWYRLLQKAGPSKWQHLSRGAHWTAKSVRGVKPDHVSSTYPSRKKEVEVAVQRQWTRVASEAQRNFSRRFFFDALAAGLVTPSAVDTVVTNSVTATDAATVLGEAVRAGVPVYTTTIKRACGMCTVEMNADAANGMTVISHALGISNTEWMDTELQPLEGFDTSSARSDAIHKRLQIWRGGFGVDSALDLVRRYLQAGVATAELVDHVARGACFTAADVHSLLLQSSEAGVVPDMQTVEYLAKMILVEADPEEADLIFRQGPVGTRAVVDQLRRDTSAQQLHKARLTALTTAFSKGDRGFNAAMALFSKWCLRGREILTPALARYVLMQQHFSEGAHEQVLRKTVSSGVEPDSGVYAALITRHRLEGDEAAARQVVSQMTRAGVATDQLHEVLSTPEDRLMKQRQSFISQKVAQGPRGLRDMLEAVKIMADRGRADEYVIELAIKYSLYSGDLESGNALYEKAVECNVLDVFKPPRRGNTHVHLKHHSPEIATFALSQHLAWLRDQLISTEIDVVSTGAWCYHGLELQFNEECQSSKSKGAPRVHTAIAIYLYLKKVGLRFSSKRDFSKFWVKSADLADWARTCSPEDLTPSVEVSTDN